MTVARLLFLAIFFVAGSAFSAHPQGGQPIATAAVNDPMAMIRTFKEAHRTLKNEAIFGHHNISTCDFALRDDTYTAEAKRNKQYEFMLYLSSIAVTELSLERNLTQGGYPERVWRTPLESLTRRQAEVGTQRLKQSKPLNDLQTRAAVLQQKRDLLSALEIYRRQTREKLTQFEIDSEFCGGDYIGTVQIRTLPRNGAVKLMLEYLFQVCKLRKFDPYSAECDMWVAAGPAADFPQGTYRYRARWGNGVEECDMVKLVPLGSGQDDRITVRTIRETKQPCAR